MSNVVIRSTVDRPLLNVVEEVLDACGWTDIVKPNARVVIKPNLVSLDPKMITAANTSMELLEAVVTVLQRRTQDIIVGESDMINPPRRYSASIAFELNGLIELSKRQGFRLVNFSEAPTRPVDSPLLAGFEMPACILDADALITMPVLKTHAQSYFTGSLKNLWGCVPRFDRFRLHRWLHQAIAEVNRVLKPRLAVMDAIVALDGQGPTYGNPRPLNLVLASRDSVALDVTAMRLVNLDTDRARHIKEAHQLGLGEWDQERITIDGDFESHRTTFTPARCGTVLRGMDYLSPYWWFTHGVLLQPAVFGVLRRVSRGLRYMRITN